MITPTTAASMTAMPAADEIQSSETRDIIALNHNPSIHGIDTFTQYKLQTRSTFSNITAQLVKSDLAVMQSFMHMRKLN